MFENLMSRAARLYVPLGKRPFQETGPAHPLPQAQASPASMSEKGTSQAVGMRELPSAIPPKDTGTV